MAEIYNSRVKLDINRGHYIYTHFILPLLNELRKIDNIRDLLSILPFFRNEFNRLINTGARNVDSMDHMPSKIL